MDIDFSIDGDERSVSVEGSGDAVEIEKALRRAIAERVPETGVRRLVNVEARYVEVGTTPMTRVLAHSLREGSSWVTTVGVSEAFHPAICHAVLDAIAYEVLWLSSNQRV